MEQSRSLTRSTSCRMRSSANVEPYEAQIAALDAFRAAFEASGVPVKDGSWGYRLLVVDDPDGNQLSFNYPNPASGV